MKLLELMYIRRSRTGYMRKPMQVATEFFIEEIFKSGFSSAVQQTRDLIDVVTTDELEIIAQIRYFENKRDCGEKTVHDYLSQMNYEISMLRKRTKYEWFELYISKLSSNTLSKSKFILQWNDYVEKIEERM